MICRFFSPFTVFTSVRSVVPHRAEDCANWGRNSVFEGTDGDRHGHVFHADMSFLQWVPGSVYVCLNCSRLSQRNPIFGQQKTLFVGFDHMRAPQDVRYLDVCMRIPSSKHTWASVCCSRVCIHVGLRDHFGFGLSSFKATPVQLSVWQNLQHGSLRLTCACLRALGPCLLGNALLCGHHSKSCCRKHSTEAVFAGTSAEARGGGEGALGDMSPDTYIIGITVLGIASLFANISGFFNPWEDRSREW